MRAALCCAVVSLVAVALAPPAYAARIKDISSIKGVRENQIIGYGLLIGLNGTGDKNQTQFTAEALTSVLGKMGISIGEGEIKVKNVASVMVTAMLPPFARTGSHLDAVVSSLGDAKSLEGGTLIMTPLFGSDGAIYAIAQGPISVGGFSAGGGAGSGVTVNHPTVGRIANGVIVERELEVDIETRSHFEMAMETPDFTTVLRTASVINEHFGEGVARALDGGTLELEVPAAYRGRIVSFLAEMEGLEVQRDNLARVVLNERTGTVVMGAAVRVSEVAVAHGNLTVSINVSNEVSQPGPFSAGETARLSNTEVSAFEENGQLHVLEDSVTIGDLVRGLNAMGVTPRDLITIIQAIKSAGALSGELELM